ncbi:PAS domain S-box-containing protein [Halogranum amylolyticum]|uniref:PAS domain S-box-containing protein n=1 Tax=Halogranum amylolyticum TaxID=660520 RepID=A0A1H8TI70_9EURY|nr:bacterio-opsin activator domain-containing protein [Halogranum amylolyticum]SEO90577.1 PAS domain S-box-containing protein [Halogranum amylolyticum]
MGDQNGTDASSDGSTDADVFARISDAVFALDREWKITFLNERAERLFQRDGDDLRGALAWDVFPGAVSVLRENCDRALETQRSVEFDFHHQPSDAWLAVHVYPSESGVTVQVRDVTDRVQRESVLREREHALHRAYKVIADNSLSLSEQIDSLLSIVREEVGTEYATLSRIDGDEYHFEFVDAPAEADLRAGDTAPLAVTNCERVVETNQTLVLNDVEADAPELADRAGNAEWGISCYLGSPVVVEGESYGTFCFYSLDSRDESFTDWEVTFVELFSKWVSTKLEQQRYVDQLAISNELYEVTRTITSSVIEQTNREDIEAATCTRLAEASAYACAWFGTIDQRHHQVVPRVKTGFDDPFDESGATYDTTEDQNSPIAEAIRTESVQIVRNLRESPEYGVWHERATENGFDSWAVVPIGHEGVLYGVLNIYSHRPDAFTNQERTMIRKLGELVGHAITAVQRKRTLMSETVVEIEFGIQNVFDWKETSDVESRPITFERTIPVGDEKYLVYGGADERGIAKLRTAVEDIATWDSLTVISERGSEKRFELQLTKPPVISAVAARGGRVKSARIEDGDYRLIVQLPDGADVRALVDVVRESYPDTKVLAQRQTSSEQSSEDRLYPNVLDELTERQRAAVESAVYSGYFDWPRNTTGEEIAASWNVSASTFHQHLRAGEQKILTALFPPNEESESTSDAER